ncbi:MAG TPA: radical SAM protein [Candidatus Edwardsbacteria bacterium]|nr:radical SAM protein [Candidatus Edwardsbacteria bacterium]
MTTRSQEASRLLASCQLCPRRCGVDRTNGAPGYCRSGALPAVASHNAHHGEEPPISGSRGSGTIFFARCNLRCAYCQNWPISQQGQGREVSIDELAGMMLELQGRGCHNINLVTPSHVVAQVLQALAIAVPAGLNIPLVYNTSGYDSPEALRLLDGVVDIYLPDIRYRDGGSAQHYSDAPDYPAVNAAALQEMWRQVGQLRCDAEGIAERGMIVRHLVLPGDLSQTRSALQFLARELSPQVHLSLMAQYFPAHRAVDLPELARPVSEEEYRRALDWLDAYGLENGWRQELEHSGGGPRQTIVR